MPIGSLVIATSAYRGEGTSQAYAPIAFPAVADLKVTTALIKSCNRLRYQYYIGLVYTRDSYYMQDEELNQFLKRTGVIGAILSTDSNIWLERQPPLCEKEALFSKGERKAINVALEAVKILIKKNEGS